MRYPVVSGCVIPGLSCLNLGVPSPAQSVTDTDSCGYGGTSGAVIAAYTAKKHNESVILIDLGKHLGGKTTGGLGLTDNDNKYATSGLARSCYRRFGQHYGIFEQWIFEPLRQTRSGKRTVVASTGYGTFTQPPKLEIVVENVANPAAARTRCAKMFIDWSYEVCLNFCLSGSHCSGLYFSLA